MNKLLIKLTVTMLLLTAFIGSAQPGMASTLDEATIQTDYEEGSVDDVSIQSLWKRYLEAAFGIGQYFDNRKYNVKAKSANITGAVGTTTGTRAFTRKDSWASTKVTFRNYYDSIYAFGRASPANSFTKQIGISIYRNSTGTKVTGRTLNSHQGITAGRMSTGTYTVHYNVHDPIKWNLGVFYFFNSPPCTQCLPLDESQPNTIEEKQNNMLLQNYFENDTVFTIPQEEAFKENNTKSKTKKSILTINDLKNDHFDEELQEYVHSLKSFNIGDSITIADTITDIYYDSDKQASSLGFDYLDKTDPNENYKIYWEFAGDLTSQFTVGDSVSFKTEVVPINKDLNIETLDILGYQAEVAPNIDSYLLSHLKKDEEQ